MASRIVSFEALQTLLLEYWNTEGFRPLQQEAVEALLEGKDVLLFLPTGGGKSLCFQLPPLCQPHAVTVVVSPLISLAKDQVDAALDRGIDCEVFNSTVSESKKAAIISELCSGILSTKLLYTTPESLALPQLKDALKEAHAACTLRFAIDEAHCISSWGHDFRPAYLSLSSLHTEFPGAPILACTATATKQVKTSIIELLHLKSPVVLESSINRSNLRYEVRYKDLICDGSDAAAFQDLEAFVKSQAPGTCGIIYAHQRKTCDWLASSLCNVEVDAMAYHAGKDSGQRASIQSQWLEGDVDIVVATIAFGMGVDKADVRWIVHWDAPSSLEAFSQESGRAGRDGLPSLCIMYASKAHFEQMRKLERGERSGSAAGMADMALSACCRRKAVLEHFGEHRGRCNAAEEEACDFCQSPKQVAAAVARLEGAWEHKQAEAAQMEKDGGDGDAEQRADAEAAESTARMPSPLAQPARKRSRLQAQAAWQPARAESTAAGQVMEHKTAQSDGCTGGPAPINDEGPVTVTSWQQDPSPTGTPAGNHETCSASEPLDLSSSEPSEPVLAARKSTNRVPEKAKPPDSVVQQRFVSGLRRKGFKCPMRVPTVAAAEP